MVCVCVCGVCCLCVGVWWECVCERCVWSVCVCVWCECVWGSSCSLLEASGLHKTCFTLPQQPRVNGFTHPLKLSCNLRTEERERVERETRSRGDERREWLDAERERETSRERRGERERREREREEKSERVLPRGREREREGARFSVRVFFLLR